MPEGVEAASWRNRLALGALSRRPLALQSNLGLLAVLLALDAAHFSVASRCAVVRQEGVGGGFFYEPQL